MALAMRINDLANTIQHRIDLKYRTHQTTHVRLVTDPETNRLAVEFGVLTETRRFSIEYVVFVGLSQWGLEGICDGGYWDISKVKLLMNSFRLRCPYFLDEKGRIILPIGEDTPTTLDEIPF